MITGKLEPYPIFRKSAGLVEDPVTRGSTSADPVMIASDIEGSISVVPFRGDISFDVCSKICVVF